MPHAPQTVSPDLLQVLFRFLPCFTVRGAFLLTNSQIGKRRTHYKARLSMPIHMNFI